MVTVRIRDRRKGRFGRVASVVRQCQVWTLPEPLRSYIVGVLLAWVVALVLAGANTGLRLSAALVFLALLACGIAATEATRLVKEPQGTLAHDLQGVWYLAIAVVLPPAYALLAPVPLVAHKLWRTRRTLVYRRIFSHATLGLIYGFVSFTYHAVPASIAGQMPGTGAHVLTWVAVVIGAGVMVTTLNYAFVLTAIKLSDQEVTLRELVAMTNDLLELSLAVTLTLVVAINPFLMALALPSLILCRRYLMHAQLVTQMRIDGKTGLLNAGTWQREATAEFFRALRSNSPMALIMVDIDHFSSVSDTAGRDGADQVLRGVASTLTENLRGAGLIGRVGGQEFAILLPQAGEADARRMAERLRDQIAAEPIAIEDGAHAGFVFRLTVSIGIAVLDHSRRALAELIGAADTALTVAKNSGHNRVCVVPDTDTRPV